MNFRHLNRLEKQKKAPHKAEQERLASEARQARELLELEDELHELERQEAFERRLKMAQDMAHLEQEMRVSLGLVEAPEVESKPDPKAEAQARERPSAYKPTTVTVRIAVQKDGVGVMKSFTHVYKGFNVFEARVETCKAAKKKGLHFRHYLDEVVSS